MKIVERPSLIVDVIAFDGVNSRTLKENEVPLPGEMLITGKSTWSNVFIEDLDRPVGIKIDSISIDDFTLNGIIPISVKDNIYECVIDYAVIN